MSPTKKSDFNLIVAEENKHTAVTINDFYRFFKEGYGLCGPVGVFFLSTLTAGAMIGPSFWLTFWTA
jgi:hypothetical protein